jgi:hypothetical protein
VRLVALAAGFTLLTSFDQGRLFKQDVPEGPPRLRAEGVLAAPPWAVREVVLHPSRFEGVTPYLALERPLAAEACAEGAKELPGCKRMLVYNRYDPPLVSGRDQTLEVELVEDAMPEGMFELTWRLATDRGPPPLEGVTRMRRSEGRWRLRAQGEGTAYEYELWADPGGLPGWIVDRANARQVPSVIAAVEKGAQRLDAERRAAPK